MGNAKSAEVGGDNPKISLPQEEENEKNVVKNAKKQRPSLTGSENSIPKVSTAPPFAFYFKHTHGLFEDFI